VLKLKHFVIIEPSTVSIRLLKPEGFAIYRLSGITGFIQLAIFKREQSASDVAATE